MKKTLKKIVICLVIVGVLLLNTPFLIKTKADTINNYQLIDSKVLYNEELNDGSLKFTLFYYFDFDNGSLKVRLQCETTSSYSEDYASLEFGLIRYVQSGIFDDNSSHQTIVFYDYDYSSYDGGWELNLIYSSNMNHMFETFFYYELYEDDNDVDIGFYINLGIPSQFYKGSDFGYQVGYQDGQTDTITTTSLSSWIHNIGQGVNDILSIQIFGQITLGTLVFIPIAMSVVLLLLHVWRRN